MLYSTIWTLLPGRLRSAPLELGRDVEGPYSSFATYLRWDVGARSAAATARQYENDFFNAQYGTPHMFTPESKPCRCENWLCLTSGTNVMWASIQLLLRIEFRIAHAH